MSDQSTLNSGTADPDIVLILSFYVFCVQIYLTICYFRRACGLTCDCTDTYLLFSFTGNCYGGSCQTQILHRHRILQHGKHTCAFSICTGNFHTFLHSQVIDYCSSFSGKFLKISVCNGSKCLIPITAVPGTGVPFFFILLLFKVNRIFHNSFCYALCHARSLIKILQMSSIVNNSLF